ncbi:MAG TPA: FAD-dependent oxidoreductase [Dehalococcoidia bacterium]|nr:FAD-dependent oxidoreductase [Dehalococcoidia bacterium]
MRVVIIGAGPTGLGAAYRLQELAHQDWHIYEATSHVGGLASSVESNGFTYDTGGHVMFSHYKYFDELVDRLLADQYSEISREAWIRMQDRWVPYPFQNNVRYLDVDAAVQCILGLAGQRENPLDTHNFRDWIVAVFGEGIAEKFMLPYNWKVWAHPLELMDKQWMAERVSVVDLESTLRNVLAEANDSRWGPNATFKFPLRGGTGGLYQPMVPYIRDHLTLNKRVESIDNDRKVVRFSDGDEDQYDVLLSTIPLTELLPRLSAASEEARAAARRLSWSSGLFVGLGVARPCPVEDKCWVYFPEENTPFYRITYLSRYSPYMAPDANHFSLITETSTSPWKPENRDTIVDQTIDGLIATGILNESDRDLIVDKTLIEAPFAYPTPTLERDAALCVLQPFLMSHDIYSRGRFGAWLYEIGNMDHSVMQGVEFVNQVLLGEQEQTWVPSRRTGVTA